MTTSGRSSPASMALAIGAVLLAIGASSAPALRAQELVRVSGTHVSVVAPAGFEPATQFPGFRHTATGASLVITEVQGPFAAIRGGMTEQALASRGMKLLSTEPLRTASREGVLIAVAQQANGIAFRSWLWIFGVGDTTVLVIAAFPETVATTMSEPLKRAALSAAWTDVASVDHFGGLRFRLRETATLKIATRMLNTLLLTKGGAAGPVAADEPFLIVGSSLADVQVGDVQTFAKGRILQTAQIKELSDLSGRTVDVGGTPGYEILAKAKDVKTDSPLVVYQVVAVRGLTYYLVQGFVGVKLADQFVREFREVVGGLSFVE